MKYFTLVCLLVFTGQLTAQSVFTKFYGDDSKRSRANSIKQTPEGGYIICGETGSASMWDYKGYLIKTNEFGDTLWTKIYGDTSYMSYRCFNEISITPSNHYITVGINRNYISEPPYYQYNPHYNKTDAFGNVLTSTNLNDISLKYGYSMIKLSNNDCVITGDGPGGISTGDWQAHVIKVDSSANLIWDKCLGLPSINYAISIDSTQDGGFIIVGELIKNLPSIHYIFMVKTDNQGDTLWTRTYGGFYNNIPYSVKQTPDGGYLIAGCKYGIDFIQTDAYILKTDAAGTIQWGKTVGTNDYDCFSSCQVDTDGNYLFAGTSADNALLIKTDPYGTILWQKSYEVFLYAEVTKLELTSDGGFVLVGCDGDTTIPHINDIFIIKTDSLATGFVDRPDLTVTNAIDDDKSLAHHGFSISPNPVCQTAKIVLNKKLQADMLIIYDISGRIVREESIDSTHEIILNKGKLQAGMYLLKLLNHQQLIGTEKFMIN